MRQLGHGWESFVGALLEEIRLQGVRMTFAQRFVKMLSTRANYWAEFVVDAALMVYLCIYGRHLQHSGWLTLLGAFAFGVLLFSFIEYFFHRWLFHTHLPLFANGHQLHHTNPTGYDSLPFFLPGLIILCLAGLGTLVFPVGIALWIAAGITLGYTLYGLCHFTIHHVWFKHPWLKRWAAIHHIHHHHPESNFGVTTPLWDYLLGTRYVRSISI